jgi:CheY-like chemotaxis protein
MTKILLVEDDFPLMRLYQAALATDYEVSVAGTCKEAIALAQEIQPDLIILDLNLPDAPGSALIDYVEQHPALARTRMLAMTGFTHLQRHKLSPAVLEVLSKPVTPTMLLRVVQSALPHTQPSPSVGQ